MGGFQLKKKSRVVEGTKETQAGAQATIMEAVVQVAKVPRQGEGHRAVRMTLPLPRSLHTRLKLEAVRQEQSIVSLVSGWIEEKTVAA